MAYSKAREEQKWKKWKKDEEMKLRELGMDEISIQALREGDWADFNSDRRYREHQIPLLDYMGLLLEEPETGGPQIQSVEGLLGAIEDERLLHILVDADRGTLQVVVLKMMGYAPKEISAFMGMPEQTVYTKLRRLREKMKKILKAE